MRDTAIHPLEHHIAIAPDWPIEGVQFRDISPLLRMHHADTIRAMLDLFTHDELAQTDCFAGLDSRGFIFASAMASITGKGFVMIRKAGKLPPPVLQENFTLEYGEAAFELAPGQGRIILIDDVLATGGTMRAAANLASRAGYMVAGMATLIDLAYLQPHPFEWQNMRVRSLLHYPTPYPKHIAV